jgi:aminoglycoside phosphotransferase (APT) family kinase protein
MTPFHIFIEHAQRRRRLAEARALVPRLLAHDSAALAACGRPTVIAGSQLTSTNVAVIFLACPGEPACAVLKLPMTMQATEGLKRETGTLSALRADDRLGDWRRLIPVPLSSGTLDGRRYRVDATLGGRTVLDRLTEDKAAQRLLEAAADTIDVLHRATSTTVEVDRPLAMRWVDEPVDTLLARGGARGLEAQLHALRDELHHALVGRRLHVSTIHGDYWLGNLLFDGSQKSPRGVVDWDAAGERELPSIDLLHLLLYTRCWRTGRDFGDVLHEQLSGRDWPRHERQLLHRLDSWCGEGSPSERHAVLLCWLRHVAHHAEQQDDVGAFGYRRWQRRNVRPILAAL